MAFLSVWGRATKRQRRGFLESILRDLNREYSNVAADATLGTRETRRTAARAGSTCCSERTHERSDGGGRAWSCKRMSR
jgi:hypothetical protein